jgi:short subunit dehydrogenase-like uncharacterized protein
MQRALDIVVFGATGFTGRLVAEVLQARCGSGPVSWALAGRDADRLAAVRQAIGADASLPLVTADAADAQAMAALAQRARVVISTVGPYQHHGRALVHACAEAGTDYVDLCGEPLWMAQMIPLLQPAALASGARIVFSAASIPSPSTWAWCSCRPDAAAPGRRCHAGACPRACAQGWPVGWHRGQCAGHLRTGGGAARAGAGHGRPLRC